MTWPMVKLENLVSITSGFAFKSNLFSESDGVPLIRIRDVVRGVTETFYTGEYSKEFIINNGDILIGMDGDFNRARWKGGRALLNQRVCKIKADESNLCDNYLYHFLPKALDSINEKTHAVTVKHLSVKGIRDIKIPLPPLTEQKRIAAILDKADAIRQKRQEAIALADDFLRSIFLDMFGDPVTNPKEWDIYPLKNGITNITAGWSANGENHSCGDDEIGVLKISAVTSGIFKPNENKVVSSSNIPSNKKLVFPRKGDLLFSRANTRELVGATCIVDSDYDNVFLPDKLWVINLNSNELLPEYVHMLIQHPKFKECLTSQATGSSGSMLNISKAKFEGTLAPYPSLDVQHRFKDIFWKVMTCNALTNDSKINFDNQFNALSQKAFSGQL